MSVHKNVLNRWVNGKESFPIERQNQLNNILKCGRVNEYDSKSQEERLRQIEEENYCDY